MLNIWNSRGKFTKYGTKIPKISIPIYRKLLKLPWGFLKSKNVFLEKFQAAKTPEFGAWAKLLVWLWMPINHKVFKIQTSNFGDLWINTLVFSAYNYVLIVSKLQPVFNFWWCTFFWVTLYIPGDQKKWGPVKIALKQSRIKIFMWKLVYIQLNNVQLPCQNFKSKFQPKQSKSLFL